MALAAILTGQLTLVFIGALMAGSFVEMQSAITGPLVGHIQIQSSEWRAERALDASLDELGARLDRLRGMEGVVSAWPRVFAPALVANGAKLDPPPPAEIGTLIGVDIASEREAGGLLDGLEDSVEAGEVVLGRTLANRLGLGVGDSVAVIGQDVDQFPVSELFIVGATLDSPVELVQNSGLVAPIAEVQELLALADQAHEILIVGASLADAPELAEAIERQGAFKDAQVLTWKEALPELAGMMEIRGWIDLIFVGVFFATAAAGIANTTLMSTFERTREFGMLLALGAKPRRIVEIVLIESTLLGLIGVGLGSAIGLALVWITSRTGIDYSALGEAQAEAVSFGGLNISFVVYPVLEWRHVFYGFVAVVLTSLVASAAPARHAACLEPTKALRR